MKKHIPSARDLLEMDLMKPLTNSSDSDLEKQYRVWHSTLPFLSQQRIVAQDLWRTLLEQYMTSDDRRLEFDAIVYHLNEYCKSYIEHRLTESEEDDLD